MSPPRSRSCREAGLAVALIAIAAGCGTDPESPPHIAEVSPGRAYNDVPLSLLIRGGPFRPSYSIDTQSGEAEIRNEGYAAVLTLASDAAAPTAPADPVAAEGIFWQSSAALVAELPPGIPAGTYDLAVADPRGTTISAPRVFVSLGPDTSPPVVTLDSPVEGEVLGADSLIQVDARAGDGDGELAAIEWTVTASGSRAATGTCAVPARARQTTCAFAFLAPTPSRPTEVLTLEVRAVDRAGLSAAAESMHLLARPPAVESITPLKGTTLGGTEVSVRGSNLLRPGAATPGTELLFGGLAAEVIRVNEDGTLVGRAPPHAPGFVSVVVRNGGAETRAEFFEYLPPAAVRGLNPAFGSPAGGTPITIVGNEFRAGETVVLFGATPLLCPRYVSSQRIEGIVPPGTGVVSVTARNPIGGSAPIFGTYRYDPAAGDPGGAGTGCPAASGTAER